MLCCIADINQSLAGICGADEAECKFLDNISKVCGDGSMSGGAGGGAMGGGAVGGAAGSGAAGGGAIGGGEIGGHWG